LSAQLQDKAAIEAKLSEHVTSLEVQLRSNEKSIREMQPKYMDALRDRGVYEQERNNALAEAKKMATLLEASKAATASAKEQNDVLESRLDAATALLGDSPNPDIAQFSSAWKDLREAKAKVDSLEKKLATAQKDMDYSRDAYQRASTSASELGIENGELKDRIKELEKMAGDNITKIQQIQARNESLVYLRELDELKAIVKDRERELDRLREDVRQLRSGRRDTRYASVPRSPRIGVMSPRVNRSAGGGTTSRGTSPTSFGGYDAGVASGMSLFNQEPGNGRWGHLRD
jgi:chromosome segregation ATPase